MGGGVVLLVGLGIISLDEPMKAPRYVVIFVGGALIAAGGLLLQPPKRSGWAHVFAFCCYFGLTATFWWTAAAPSELFEGHSIPFLSREINVRIARFLFGAVAALGTLVLIYAPIALVKQRLRRETLP